jgi:hypothetical protein
MGLDRPRLRWRRSQYPDYGVRHMKMPQRPWYPPISPQLDIFGLQTPTILGEACESPSEKQKRIEKVKKGVADAFTAAARQLGEDAARDLFKRIMRRSKRGRGKTLAPHREWRLLKEYDARPKGVSVAALAKRLRAEGMDLGATQDAIEFAIRQAVKSRKQREHAAAVESRRWRMATRGEVSLLTIAGGDKK